jgi:superfamily II DNA/RNA helicase
LAPKIEALIKDFLKNPVKISVIQKHTNSIYQDIIKYKTNRQKKDTLVGLLSKEDFRKVLIFTRTKRGADELSEDLFTNKIKNVSIHGDKRQSKRRNALKSFKKEMVKVMIATDVAARGLDIDNVSHVINYDIPATKDDYIHRIGRTARANKTGAAYTFIKENERASDYHQRNSRRHFTHNRNFHKKQKYR